MAGPALGDHAGRRRTRAARRRPPSSRPRVASGHRPPLLPGDASAGCRRCAGRPDRDRQVPPASLAWCDAQHDHERRAAGSGRLRRAAGMTTFERFEGDLPQLLEELAPLRTPDYLDLVFGRTVRAHQRPAWTFLERWLPTSTLTERMASDAPRPMASHLHCRLVADRAHGGCGSTSAASRSACPSHSGRPPTARSPTSRSGTSTSADPIDRDVDGIVSDPLTKAPIQLLP